MELQQTFNNLKESRDLIAQYVELDSRIWEHNLCIKNYNRKRLFNALSFIVTALLMYILTTGPGPKASFAAIIYVGPLTFICFRFLVGDVLDKMKRAKMIEQIKPEILKLSEEMNRLVEKLDSFTLLPPKYRTLHAVDTIGGYFVNKRIDSLKEGINLYEDELFKSQQLQNQHLQIHQNSQMIQQNNKMIQQNKQMINAQSVTNTLLIFGR